MKPPLKIVTQPALVLLDSVARHMRARDREEIFCQLADGTTPGEVANAMHQYSRRHRYVGTVDGVPVAAWGAYETQICVWSAWAFGTRRMNAYLREITDHILTNIRDDLVASTAQRVEIRALTKHARTAKWLASMGCIHEGDMLCYGKNGETFSLWAWRRSDYAEGCTWETGSREPSDN